MSVPSVAATPQSPGSLIQRRFKKRAQTDMSTNRNVTALRLRHTLHPTRWQIVRRRTPAGAVFTFASSLSHRHCTTSKASTCVHIVCVRARATSSTIDSLNC